ncbi:MAG: hypothetical protein LBS27_07145 [Bifidobacteriaceae bacterium]|nr:hypothetical protein [Bifidobacteriaceae bacterium]
MQNLAKAAGAPRSSPGAAGAVPGARPDQTTAPGSTSGSAAAPAPSPSRSAGPRPTISFTPTLVPMSRGILATVTAKPGPRFDPAQLRRPWELAYGDERFVHLLAPGQWPSTAQTLGANTALIQVAHDTRADRVVLVCVIDNLVKGTAGQAIQSINLALGLPEATGLELNGVAP